MIAIVFTSPGGPERARLILYHIGVYAIHLIKEIKFTYLLAMKIAKTLTFYQQFLLPTQTDPSHEQESFTFNSIVKECFLTSQSTFFERGCVVGIFLEDFSRKLTYLGVGTYVIIMIGRSPDAQFGKENKTTSSFEIPSTRKSPCQFYRVAVTIPTSRTSCPCMPSSGSFSRWATTA